MLRRRRRAVGQRGTVWRGTVETEDLITSCQQQNEPGQSAPHHPRVYPESGETGTRFALAANVAETPASTKFHVAGETGPRFWGPVFLGYFFPSSGTHGCSADFGIHKRVE